MKRILEVLFSSKTTVVLLIIAAIAMGTGTFVEDKYDTITARAYIYNTKWFELLFILLAINFIGHIKRFHMLRKQRLGGVLFHLAFIIMIIGAGVTRYFGYEGNMRIREGEASNILFSSESFLRVSIDEKGNTTTYDYPVAFSEYLGNSFHVSVPTETKGKIELTCNGYIKNADEKIEENSAGGVDMLELVVATENGRERMFVAKGDVKNVGTMDVAFQNNSAPNAIQVREENGHLLVKSPFIITSANMAQQLNDTIPADSITEFKNGCLYSSNDALFFFKRFYKSGVKKLGVADAPVGGPMGSSMEGSGFDALLFDATINSKPYDASFLFAPGQVAEDKAFNFDGTKIKLAYGKKPIELPFSIRLNDFILERYPGSESPSSYASEVTVLDSRNSIKLNHRIFMNNILDYDGFRFFQSSYDQDEKGTILSVNHDFWGTWISYFGYAMLALGCIITLLNKDSRFLSLRRIIAEVRKERKSGAFTIALILGLSLSSFAQSDTIPPVDAEHAELFGRLITQANDGRFEPVNTLAYDVLHKITRKDKFNLEGRGEMSGVQVYLDMMTNPDFWKRQSIIYIKEQSVRDLVGITSKNGAFIDFFDAQGNYKLQKYADDAFRKKPVEQNNFDKEIIKLDERLNVFMMVFKGSILKIFPEPGSPNNKWISFDEPFARVPLTGVINVINQDLKLQVLNYNGIMRVYAQAIIEAKKTGDYSLADRIVGYITSIQRQDATTNLLPSETKISAEVFFNKAQIFITLRNFYSILSLFLLLLAFIDNVRTKKNKIVTTLLNFGIVLLAAGFLYQTFGMVLRWYLLGYAPWSNGYEALLLVAWATLLAGFSFVRYSKITMAATSLLAFFVLMTASHSSYDPQLTNLTPVLKSYWLIIHVAVLTISYGFLGLGFILGLMNLAIYLFKTKENHKRLDLLIFELTYINEMNITIGLILATIGTFLGGVWANESWGRYWGWDAKETWALVIVITYTLLLHLRFVPKLHGKYVFNVASVISFGSVLMTFFGVNYFLSKGMHSYGAGDHAIFPMWAWISIGSIVALMIAARIKENYANKHYDDQEG
ncbi:MAG: cytochrome c biogenesis protein CcsA [Bacteroidetes bacterium]|nr:cytochrome c biogenesis protein CcsA [Bacteroidota bacterium]